jgi:hypothetical protein
VRRGLATGIAAGLATLGLIAGIETVGDRHEVSGDEVPRALRALGYRYQWRRAPRPRGVDRVIAGRAVDSRGVALDFAVAVHDGPAYEASPAEQPLPVVRHAASRSSCANYTLVDDASDPSATRRTRARRSRMRNRIEDALDDLVPGRHCEG